MPTKNKQEDTEGQMEREAWVDFQQQSGPRRPRKPVDKSLARKNAQSAVSAALEDLAHHAPQTASAGNVAQAQGSLDALDTPSANYSDPATVNVGSQCVCKRCMCALGTQVRGVSAGGEWWCPKCFCQSVRDYSQHPQARAIDCPTCHHTSVDFTGRNFCSVCHARGARPV